MVDQLELVHHPEVLVLVGVRHKLSNHLKNQDLLLQAHKSELG